ncbi:MAG: hypothetical protein ACLTLQ_03185 [[Clostridium] scindens]
MNCYSHLLSSEKMWATAPVSVVGPLSGACGPVYVSEIGNPIQPP